MGDASRLAARELSRSTVRCRGTQSCVTGMCCSPEVGCGRWEPCGGGSPTQHTPVGKPCRVRRALNHQSGF